MSIPLASYQAAAAAGWITALAAVLAMLHKTRHSKQLLERARTDWTGLLTKPAWQHDAEIELTSAKRTGSPLAAAMLDIDHFKQVNDRFGHLAGDSVLRMIAETTRTQLRPYDLAGRFGGDEVVILFPGTTARQAERIVERLRASIATTAVATAAGEQLTVTVSAGISDFGQEAADLGGLLLTADTALYEGKRDGRDRVRRSRPLRVRD